MPNTGLFSAPKSGLCPQPLSADKENMRDIDRIYKRKAIKVSILWRFRTRPHPNRKSKDKRFRKKNSHRRRAFQDYVDDCF